MTHPSIPRLIEEAKGAYNEQINEQINKAIKSSSVSLLNAAEQEGIFSVNERNDIMGNCTYKAVIESALTKNTTTKNKFFNLILTLSTDQKSPENRQQGLNHFWGLKQTSPAVFKEHYESEKIKAFFSATVSQLFMEQTNSVDKDTGKRLESTLSILEDYFLLFDSNSQFKKQQLETLSGHFRLKISKENRLNQLESIIKFLKKHDLENATKTFCQSFQTKFFQLEDEDEVKEESIKKIREEIKFLISYDLLPYFVSQNDFIQRIVYLNRDDLDRLLSIFDEEKIWSVFFQETLEKFASLNLSQKYNGLPTSTKPLIAKHLSLNIPSNLLTWDIFRFFSCYCDDATYQEFLERETVENKLSKLIKKPENLRKISNEKLSTLLRFLIEKNLVQTLQPWEPQDIVFFENELKEEEEKEKKQLQKIEKTIKIPHNNNINLETFTKIATKNEMKNCMMYVLTEIKNKQKQNSLENALSNISTLQEFKILIEETKTHIHLKDFIKTTEDFYYYFNIDTTNDLPTNKKFSSNWLNLQEDNDATDILRDSHLKYQINYWDCIFSSSCSDTKKNELHKIFNSRLEKLAMIHQSLKASLLFGITAAATGVLLAIIVQAATQQILFNNLFSAATLQTCLIGGLTGFFALVLVSFLLKKGLSYSKQHIDQKINIELPSH